MQPTRYRYPLFICKCADNTVPQAHRNRLHENIPTDQPASTMAQGGALFPASRAYFGDMWDKLL